MTCVVTLSKQKNSLFFFADIVKNYVFLDSDRMIYLQKYDLMTTFKRIHSPLSTVVVLLFVITTMKSQPLLLSVTLKASQMCF